MSSAAASAGSMSPKSDPKRAPCRAVTAVRRQARGGRGSRGGWRKRPARRYLGAMTRILLLIPSRTYRTADFIEAASALDIEVVVGMEERPAVADVMGERWLALSLTDVASGRQAIVDYAQEHPLDAVIPIDDGSTLVAAAGAAALGLPPTPL